MDRKAWSKVCRQSFPRPRTYVDPSIHLLAHLSTRRASIGLDGTANGTRTMRRVKASLIYRRAKNLGAVQPLLGLGKLESTVRHLDIEVDDAFEMAAQVKV